MSTWNKLTLRESTDEEKEVTDFPYQWEGPTPELFERVLVMTEGLTTDDAYFDVWMDFLTGKSLKIQMLSLEKQFIGQAFLNLMRRIRILEVNRKEKLLKSLCQMIVSDAKRRKEKVIAIDSETFQKKKGKIVELRLTSGVIGEIEKYLLED